MTENKRADMLRKIRAMLAKADSTPEQGEADVFRAKAEALMLQYKIDLHELGDQAEDSHPSAFNRDFAWYWDSQHGSFLWQMMTSVAHHCNVKIVTWKVTYQDIPIVGTEADVEYFDMLFTSLMMEMGRGLEPKPTRDNSFIENVFMLKNAGQQWNRICDQLHAIGQMPPEYDEFAPGQWLTSEAKDRKRKFIHKMNLAGKYQRHCKAVGHEPLKMTPKVYQRSFAYGFVNEISTRLFKLRQYAQEQTGSTSSGMELVLASARDRANRKAIEIYGEPPRSKGRGAKAKRMTIDERGVGAGRTAARNVDLHNAQKVSSGRGALPQG